MIVNSVLRTTQQHNTQRKKTETIAKMDDNVRFDVIQRMLEDQGLVSHQIDSFNHFIECGIQKSINEENTVTITTENNIQHRYTFGDACVGYPTIIDDMRMIKHMQPIECRFKDITYEATLSVNIHVDVLTEDNVIIESEIIRNYPLAKIPIMVGSNRCILTSINSECENEPKGYWIIRGKERVLISQERAVYNNIISTLTSEGVVTDFRSMSLETGHSALTQCFVSNTTIQLNLPCLSNKLHVGVIFQAFGLFGNQLAELLKPKHIIETLDDETIKNYDKMILLIHKSVRFIQLVDPQEYQATARRYIEQFVVNATDHPGEYVDQVLECEIFPHLGGTPLLQDTIWNLSNIVIMSLLTFIGARPADSKDHLCNKRVECAGTLLNDLFRTSYKRFVRSLAPYLQKQQNIQHVIQRVNYISKDIRYVSHWNVYCVGLCRVV